MTNYSLLLGLGAVISLLRLARVTPEKERIAWLGSGTGFLFGALAGAWLDYCFERFSYYGQHPMEIFAFWRGGLAWQGAAAGAIAVMLLAAVLRRQRFAQVLDTASVMVLPISVAAWLGAWMEGEAYGAALPAGAWWGLPSLNAYGEAGLFVPVQLMASLSLLVMIALVETITVRIKKAGLRGALVWLTFSLIMVLFTRFRADPSPLLKGIRIETWAAMILSGIFLLVSLWLSLVGRRRPAEITVAMPDEAKDVEL